MVRRLAEKDFYSIDLVQEGGEWTLRVSDSGPEGGLSLFPAQVSLLRAVTTGMSYQIAGDHGSLNLSNLGEAVGVTVHLESGYRFIAEIPTEKFAGAIEELSRE